MTGRGRRAVIVGIPLLYLGLGLLHPTENPGVGDPTGLWLALHAAQLIMVPTLAFASWLLIQGETGRAATAARALLVPFVTLYTALDAILGLAWGMVARRAANLAVADQAAAARLLDDLLRADPAGYALYFGAGALWLTVVVAIAAARRGTAPKPALVVFVLGAAVFALGHARPTGPLGMALFLAGVIWSESSRTRRHTSAPATAKANQATATQS